MPPKVAGRLVKELEHIAVDPSQYAGDWKRLSSTSYWRLRVGDYRAICDLRDDALILLVINVGPRGDIYK